MPTVFSRMGDRPKFHRSKDCPQLTKPPARGEAHPVQEVDLLELDPIRPCRTCFPDAPRAKTQRRFCPICNHIRALPCQHNGGVRVTYEYQTNYTSLLRDPGDSVLRSRWVWPDQVWMYDL